GVKLEKLTDGFTIDLQGNTETAVTAEFVAAAASANITASGLTKTNTVNVNGAGVKTVTFSGNTGTAEGLIIDNTGTDAVTTVNLNANAKSGFQVSGDKINLVDASKSTAGVNVVLGTVAADLTIKGG